MLNTGIDSSLLSPLLSGGLLAFHPRPACRRQQTRQEHELASNLGVALAHKVLNGRARSIYLSEVQGTPHVTFDSRSWRGYLSQESELRGVLVSERFDSTPHRENEDFPDSLRRSQR